MPAVGMSKQGWQHSEKQSLTNEEYHNINSIQFFQKAYLEFTYKPSGVAIPFRL